MVKASAYRASNRMLDEFVVPLGGRVGYAAAAHAFEVVLYVRCFVG